MSTVTYEVALGIEECCTCGMQFAMPQEWQRRRRSDKQEFYCPAGHGQFYKGRSDQQKLKDAQAALDWERKQRQAAERDLLTTKQQHGKTRAKLKRTLDRVERGVCPHCNRTFQNLQRHMETKHSEVCA